MPSPTLENDNVTLKHVRIKPSLWARLTARAQAADRSTSYLLNEAAGFFLENEELYNNWRAGRQQEPKR